MGHLLPSSPARDEEGLLHPHGPPGPLHRLHGAAVVLLSLQTRINSTEMQLRTVYPALPSACNTSLPGPASYLQVRPVQLSRLLVMPACPALPATCDSSLSSSAVYSRSQTTQLYCSTRNTSPHGPENLPIIPTCHLYQPSY